MSNNVAKHRTHAEKQRNKTYNKQHYRVDLISIWYYTLYLSVCILERKPFRPTTIKKVVAALPPVAVVVVVIAVDVASAGAAVGSHRAAAMI